jgi:undecaprenyl pyrophosphate phosphatase UppP
MTRINFGALERLSLFQYIGLSVIISILAALLVGLFFHDSASDLVLWIITAGIAGIVLGLIEHAMIRKLKRRRARLVPTKGSSLGPNRRGKP